VLLDFVHKISDDTLLLVVAFAACLFSPHVFIDRFD